MKQTAKCVIPGFENSPPDEQANALKAICQRVFTTEEGRIVFNMLMTDLRFFDEANTEAEVALSEYAKFFLRERLGIVNTLDATNALMKTLTVTGR